MRGVKTNENKAYSNIHFLVALFCIVALFETAFLGLTIQDWSADNIAIYSALVLALQITAYLKAVCVWHINHQPLKVIVYISCVIITGLFTYSVVEAFIVLTTIFASAPLMHLNSVAVASIDGLMSLVLLHGFRNWLQTILKNEPLQLFNQIRHHFLFNTLNTTVCRIPENPELAQVNLEKLAILLRKMLFLKTYISLEEEIASVKCYLEIEKYRLEERLQVSWFVARNTNVAIKVPAFILQPLVENAIYHGIENILGGGTVVISLYTVGSRLIIQVCNPIANSRPSNLSRSDSSHVNQPHKSNRVAQTNIERRLALAYADDFSFKREQREIEYRVTINIPKGGLIL